MPHIDDVRKLISADKPAADFREPYRPQFHFSPEANWLNDPNGMVYYEGEYHLFYQYHPGSTVWGPMHWGHAVSSDLVHWEHLPIGLYPDKNGFIFSGSAVVDWKDTSGLFGGKHGLVAIFTHADEYPDSDRPRQRQSIAYSTDKGRTWIMYEGNPVLADENITDFRDPKVFWHEQTSHWVMVLAAHDRVHLYTSPDLKSWSFASEFGAAAGSHDGVWECPDLFELPVEGLPGVRKWALVVSLNPTPWGSCTQYFIGGFDGTAFTNDNPDDKVLWFDTGRDNYAGVTWSDVPEQDGQRILIGWMNNWNYARLIPTSTWRGATTVPRILTLRNESEGIRIIQTPVEELAGLREEASEWENLIVTPGDNPLSGITGDAFEIIAEFELGTASEFGLKVRKSDEEETVIGYDVSGSSLFIDRTRSGVTDFDEDFGCRHHTVLPPETNRIRLQLFVDWSSVEVFANGGKLVVTDQIFPKPESRGIELYAAGGTVTLVSLKLYPLRSIHHSRG